MHEATVDGRGEHRAVRVERRLALVLELAVDLRRRLPMRRVTRVLLARRAARSSAATIENRLPLEREREEDVGENDRPLDQRTDVQREYRLAELFAIGAAVLSLLHFVLH